MCEDCIGSSFMYKEAHQLHDLPFNSDFIKTTLDYLESTPTMRKDDWRFEKEWGWIVTGRQKDTEPREHDGVWLHYLCHADPNRYGMITSVGPDGTVKKPCGKICEFNPKIQSKMRVKYD